MVTIAVLPAIAVLTLPLAASVIAPVIAPIVPVVSLGSPTLVGPMLVAPSLLIAPSRLVPPSLFVASAVALMLDTPVTLLADHV